MSFGQPVRLEHWLGVKRRALPLDLVVLGHIASICGSGELITA